MAEVAAEIGPELAPDTVVSDVGSVKESVLKVLGAALPGVHVIPAHPVAGTEKSGPDAGFSSLFKGRWCIITPPPRAKVIEQAVADVLAGKIAIAPLRGIAVLHVDHDQRTLCAPHHGLAVHDHQLERHRQVLPLQLLNHLPQLRVHLAQ